MSVGHISMYISTYVSTHLAYIKYLTPVRTRILCIFV